MAVRLESPPAARPRRARPSRAHVPLLLLLVVGAALRFYRLGHNSLWIDEIVTLDIVTRPAGQILDAVARINFCAPLYFWLVHGVVQVLGPREAALRLVSAVAGAATIPVVWALARELSRRDAVGLLAAGLLAANPLHLWYSQEARPYALLLFFGSVSLFVLARALRTGADRWWYAYALASTLTLLTHTTGVSFLLVAGLWVLARPTAKGVVRFAVACAALLVFTAPFFARVSAALASATGGHSPPRPLTGLEVPYTLFAFLAGNSFGPALREIQSLGAWTSLRQRPIQAGIAAAVWCLLVASAARGWNRRLLSAGILLAAPITLALLGAALTGKAFSVRYGLAGLLGFVVLSAQVLGSLPPRARGAAIALSLALSLWADGQWFWVPRYWKDDARAAVAYLARHLQAGQTVAVAPAYSTRVLAYYAKLAGARLRFVGIDPGGPPGGAEPARALVLTRLHHVPRWQELRSSFAAASGGTTEVEVTGFRILLTASP